MRKCSYCKEPSHDIRKCPHKEKHIPLVRECARLFFTSFYEELEKNGIGHMSQRLDPAGHDHGDRSLARQALSSGSLTPKETTGQLMPAVVVASRKKPRAWKGPGR